MAVITSQNPLSQETEDTMGDANTGNRSSGPGDLEKRLIVPLLKGNAKNKYAGTDSPFCDNTVKTGKYTPMNFVPIFLFNSFQKLVNAYFGVVALMQCKSEGTVWTCLLCSQNAECNRFRLRVRRSGRWLGISWERQKVLSETVLLLYKGW